MGDLTPSEPYGRGRVGISRPDSSFPSLLVKTSDCRRARISSRIAGSYHVVSVGFGVYLQNANLPIPLVLALLLLPAVLLPHLSPCPRSLVSERVRALQAG